MCSLQALMFTKYYDLHSQLSFFFFVKQKTAYEMRISDWSSDVCSSDLINPLALHPARYIDPRIEISLQAELHPLENLGVVCRSGSCGSIKGFMLAKSQRIDFGADVGEQHREHHDHGLVDRQGINDPDLRSEEHTSELQSPMRISYAVFCLNKKTT